MHRNVGLCKRTGRRYDVPIVEPMACAINMAIALVNLGLSHSKLCYEAPPRRGGRAGQHRHSLTTDRRFGFWTRLGPRPPIAVGVRPARRSPGSL